jgi:hypothetical protein
MRSFYGSDDGYDYSRDNRDGDVDEFIKSMEIYVEQVKSQEEKENK